MRSNTPTVHCDGDDGLCGSWDVDYYETTVWSVGGVRITVDNRAPGWVSVDGDDFCPEHAPAKTGPTS